MTDTEVPWFSEPPEATIRWVQEPTLGHLWFIDPKGRKATVPVTKGETYTIGGKVGMHVWHIDIDGDTATVSPSIHYVGWWHSPNPVVLKLVDRLPEVNI